MGAASFSFGIPAIVGIAVLAWYIAIPVLLWQILKELRRIR